MNVASITLIFENLESFTVPAKLIKHFYLDNIQTSMDFHNDDQETPNINTMRTAQHMLVQFDAAANCESADEEQHVESFNLVERLENYRDVSCVELEYDDGHKEQIYVDWDTDQSEYQNKNQSVAVDDSGDFYLVVSETLRANSYITCAVQKTAKQ